jgi:hypothetical protein
MPSTTAAVKGDEAASLSSVVAVLLDDDGNAESGDALADPFEGMLEF